MAGPIETLLLIGYRAGFSRIPRQMVSAYVGGRATFEGLLAPGHGDVADALKARTVFPH